jgi:hypothetical protein
VEEHPTTQHLQYQQGVVVVVERLRVVDHQLEAAQVVDFPSIDLDGGLPMGVRQADAVDGRDEGGVVQYPCAGEEGGA